jgi:hypothetical protein
MDDFEGYEIRAYKIWYDDKPEEIYIGSTRQTLSKRMGCYRTQALNRRDVEPLIYKTIRTKGINDFKYVQLASCMVKNRDEQRQFEQSWIDELKPCLNTNKAFKKNGSHNTRIRDARLNIHKKIVTERKKKEEDEKAKKNAEYEARFIICECGKKVYNIPYKMNIHIDSAKHKKYLKSQE